MQVILHRIHSGSYAYYKQAFALLQPLESRLNLLQSELPLCAHCDLLARPNVLMFDDWSWLPARTEVQLARLHAWRLEVSNPVLVEIGAGVEIPSVRRLGESLNIPLIRINPKHPDIEKRQGVGLSLGALEGLQHALLFVDLRIDFASSPDGLGTGAAALHVVKRPMDFGNARLVKTRFLELPIHIAGKYESAVRRVSSQFLQNGEPCVRHRVPVQFLALPIESPCQTGNSREGFRIGDFEKIDPLLFQRRISFPETIVAAKVGHPRIDVDSYAGADQNAVRLLDQPGSLCNVLCNIHLYFQESCQKCQFRTL
jgi:hypothetical protein